VRICGAATGKRVVRGRDELGPGQARSHEVPVVGSEKLGAVPVRMMEEAVGTGVARESAVDHVQTVIRGERNCEGRPLGPFPQPQLEVSSCVVVRAVQQFLNLFALGTRVEVTQPEVRLLQEPSLVSERATVVTRYPGRMQIYTVFITEHIMPPRLRALEAGHASRPLRDSP
jgi:hypothetical protein